MSSDIDKTRAWPDFESRPRSYGYFNSHAHVERDFIWLTVKSVICKFQLTRSRGAWRKSYKWNFAKANFNSHAHVERDCVYKSLWSAWFISTHTLTWSVTFFLILLVDLNDISTHTLTWSVTLFQPLSHKWDYFNSHAHVERDQMKCDIYVLKKISTHTLTWSVTKCGIME